MKNTIKNDIIAAICLFVFAVITILRMANHIPWFDEAHAWTIAEQLNYVDMFNYTKNEGHFFIWQSLLYPFAHSHIIPYPYAMQALNWIFCFAALIVMWRFAPFNNCIKALITFSFPFLGCYGVLARCYSIGILFLFLLAALYDKKLKYPKTYALLLILCANTSVMALIGATAFGLLFLYDFLKSDTCKQRDKFLVFFILGIGVIFVSYQLFNLDYFLQISSNRKPHISVKIFRNTFIYNGLILNCILLVLFAIPIVKYLLKNKSGLFFVGFTYLILLTFCTCVYGASFWHSYFFYVYLIIALWLCPDNIDARFAMIAVALISLIFVFHKPANKDYYMVYNKNSFELRNIIESDEILNKSKIIQNHGVLCEVLPYSYGKTYVLKEHCKKENNTDYDLLNHDNKICAIKNTVNQAKRYPETLKQIVDDNTYTFIDKREYKTDKNSEVVKTGKYEFYFKKYKCFEHYCFYKIYVK